MGFCPALAPLALDELAAAAEALLVTLPRLVPRDAAAWEMPEAAALLTEAEPVPDGRALRSEVRSRAWLKAEASAASMLSDGEALAAAAACE